VSVMVSCSNLTFVLVFSYHEENIPSHPCFKLVSNCEQILSTFIARRLITLQKVREPSSLKVGFLLSDQQLYILFEFFKSYSTQVRHLFGEDL